MSLHRLVVIAIAGIGLVVAGSGGAARAARPEPVTGEAACPVGATRPEVAFRADATGRGGSIALTDATSAWNLDAALRGMLVHAVAAADVDADGWTDLFVGSFADRPPSEYQVRGADGPTPDQLLLGGPDGFTVDAEFPGALARTSGAAFADLDGDGDADLVIARNVKDIDHGRVASEVLRNDGGRFTRATTLRDPRGARSVGLLDYDHDGAVDLFVTEDRWTGGSSRLLHNDGGFRFTDVTTRAGIPDDVVGMGVGTADLNGDGAPDLVVGGSNRIFLGNRAGGFHEGDSRRFAWTPFGDEDDPAGVAVGDLNRDGRTDVVIGQHYGSTIDFGRRVPVRLYLNVGNDSAGDPRFRDVTDDAGLTGLATKAPHVELADLDNDGWLDIVTSASVDATTPVVFRNLGAEGPVPRFVANGASGPARYWPSGAVLDADHDGRLDVVLAEFDARAPSLILRNTSPGGHWLAVAAAPTTRVELFGPGPEGRRSQRLGDVTIASSTGFGAGSAAVATFGLGAIDTVDVRVSQAGSTVATIRGQRVDRLVSVRCTAHVR